MYVIVDQFDSSGTLILNVGICKDCGKETLLIQDECALCMEERIPILKEISQEAGLSIGH